RGQDRGGKSRPLERADGAPSARRRHAGAQGRLLRQSEGTRRSAMTAAQLPVGKGKAQMVEAMFNRIAPRYELVNAVMTLGLDSWWRRRAVRALALPESARVLDLGCGTGDLCRELSRAGYRPVGIDAAAEMLTHA